MRNHFATGMAAALVVCFGITAAQAQTTSAPPQHSNIGLKLNLGLGSRNMTKSQDLEEGGAIALSLGYGVAQRVTLWLGLNASSHQHENNVDLESDLVGVELAVQYKLRPHQRLRPYGVFGIGGFALGNETTDTVLSGGGVAWAVGAEYRLVRFLTVGAELYWKDFDYDKIRIGKDNDFEELDRPIQGNTHGLMINLTLH